MAPTSTNDEARSGYTRHENHDVVIIGAGPAGLMLATCLAQMGVKSFIVDSEDASHHARGRGDALQCRTIEVMRSIGLGQKMVDAGVKMFTRTFWDMNSSTPRCTSRSDFFSPDIDCDDCYSLGIRQGLVEDILAQRLHSVAGITVARRWSFEDAEVRQNTKSGVVVSLRSEYGDLQTVQAKYLIGCDGGKSSVRRMLRDKHDITLGGDAHDSRWSAVDVTGVRSDFPDLRNLCILHGKSSTILVIPRESIDGKPCVRFYCQVDDKQVENPTVQEVAGLVKETFAPYTVEWDQVHWFTVYKVGQRLVSTFHHARKVFLAGDAAHLHSPKGGLGMNTSLLDAHNLAIKIAMVERFGASPAILDTYDQERRLVAEQLISMDRELIELFAKHRVATPETAAALGAFQRRNEAYQSGTSILYPPNPLVRNCEASSPRMQVDKEFSGGLVPGARLLPATVTRHNDSNPLPVLDSLKPFDGHFTVFVCLGQQSAGCLKELSEHIVRSGGMWATLSKLVQLVVITMDEHLSWELSQDLASWCSQQGPFFPSAVYCDDIPCISPYTDTPSIMVHPLHTKWNVDKDSGALVIVRPDGHVGAVTNSIGEWDEVEAYFSPWLPSSF